MSTFAHKVLEDTKHLIVQKIWCWQLADKLACTDDAFAPLLPNANYPITQAFPSLSLFTPLACRTAQVECALNMYVPGDLRGHQSMLRERISDGGAQGTPEHAEGKN